MAFFRGLTGDLPVFFLVCREIQSRDSQTAFHRLAYGKLVENVNARFDGNRPIFPAILWDGHKPIPTYNYLITFSSSAGFSPRVTTPLLKP
jgi:hypothetical protein